MKIKIFFTSVLSVFGVIKIIDISTALNTGVEVSIIDMLLGLSISVFVISTCILMYRDKKRE